MHACTRNAKDAEGVLLEKNFLVWTFRINNNQIASQLWKSWNAPKGPQHPISKQIQIGHQEHISTTMLETTEFNTHSSLVSKLWLGRTHQWLGYHIACGPSVLTVHMETGDVVYSARYICMFCPNDCTQWQIWIQLSESAGWILSTVPGSHWYWCKQLHDKKHEQIRADPSLFHSFGNACLREKDCSIKSSVDVWNVFKFDEINST